MDDLLIPAEARGRRRLWKAAAAARWASVCAAFGDREVRRAAQELCRLTGRHRAAVIVLKRAFASAVLEIDEGERRRPCLVWSAIDASADTPIVALDGGALSDEAAQPMSSVHYVLAGARDRGVLIRGNWGLSVTDFAVGRLFERWPQADPDIIIREAHRALLDAPFANIRKLVKAGDLLLPTSEGAFRVHCAARPTVETKVVILHTVAHSWTSDAQLLPEEIERSMALLQASPGEVTLRQTALHPAIMRGEGRATAA